MPRIDTSFGQRFLPQDRETMDSPKRIFKELPKRNPRRGRNPKTPTVSDVTLKKRRIAILPEKNPLYREKGYGKKRKVRNPGLKIRTDLMDVDTSLPPSPDLYSPPRFYTIVEPSMILSPSGTMREAAPGFYYDRNTRYTGYIRNDSLRRFGRER